MEKITSTELEVKLRESKALKEEEWKTAGKEEGLKIWRIENLKVVQWPKKNYGQFFGGDSYIILNTKLNSFLKEYEYIVHVWIGKTTSKDEAGTANYKAMELDDCLAKKTTIIFEQQGMESDLFVSYFPKLMIMEGGIDSQFKNVESNQYRPRLYQVKGKGKNVVTNQVPLNFKSMNSADVFVLDAGLKIYNWRGKTSTSFEKYQGALIAKNICEERNSKPEVICIEQGNEENEFNEIFTSNEEPYNEINNVCVKKMFRLSDEQGKLALVNVDYSKDNLDSNDAFLIDRGDALLIWIGSKVSKSEKKFASVYAKKYLNQEDKSESIKIILIHEGKLQEEIDKSFQ